VYTTTHSQKAPGRSTLRALLRSSLASLAAVLAAAGRDRVGRPLPVPPHGGWPALPRVARSSQCSDTRSRPSRWRARVTCARDEERSVASTARGWGGMRLRCGRVGMKGAACWAKADPPSTAASEASEERRCGPPSPAGGGFLGVCNRICDGTDYPAGGGFLGVCNRICDGTDYPAGGGFLVCVVLCARTTTTPAQDFWLCHRTVAGSVVTAGDVRTRD